MLCKRNSFKTFMMHHIFFHHPTFCAREILLQFSTIIHILENLKSVKSMMKFGEISFTKTFTFYDTKYLIIK